MHWHLLDVSAVAGHGAVLLLHESDGCSLECIAILVLVSPHNLWFDTNITSIHTSYLFATN